MGKGTEKHPCRTCGWLKVAKPGSSMRCVHPDIVQADAYKYGKTFTCRCVPKWCPKDPDKSYLGQELHISEAERKENKCGGKRSGSGRKPHAQTTQDNTIPTKPIELDRVKVEMERVKNETENEMKNEQTLDNSITEQMQEKIAYASEQRKRLGSLVYRIDLSNRDKSLDRTDEMIATENRISETLMNLLDVYDGIQ